MKSIDVGTDFFHRLANRDETQGDGTDNAVEFREKYLFILDSQDAWVNSDVAVILDFKNVKKLGPSFANEAFAYFTQYASPKRILGKIKIINITEVKLETIMEELETGHRR